MNNENRTPFINLNIDVANLDQLRVLHRQMCLRVTQLANFQTRLLDQYRRQDERQRQHATVQHNLARMLDEINEQRQRMRFRHQIIVREMDQIREQRESFRLERQALDHKWNILQREQDSLDRERRLFNLQREATTPNNIFDIIAQFHRQEE